MNHLLTRLTIAQLQEDNSGSTLIDQGGEDLIYFGLVIMIFIIILAVGVMNRRMGQALVFATLVSIALIITLYIL
jgi:VanZ family protein